LSTGKDQILISKELFYKDLMMERLNKKKKVQKKMHLQMASKLNISSLTIEPTIKVTRLKERFQTL